MLLTSIPYPAMTDHKHSNHIFSHLSLLGFSYILMSHNVLQNDLASMNTGNVFEVEESSFDYSNYKEYVKFEKVLKNILK